MSKFILIAFLCTTSQLLFCQNIDKIILSDIQFDSSKIASENIRSAHIFTEFVSKNEYDSANYIQSSKRMEIEFNAFGMRTYLRYNYLFSEGHALGERGTIHNSFEYNNKHQLENYCQLEKRRSICEHYTYNAQGNIISLKAHSSGDQLGKYTFEWKEGKMIRVKEFDSENNLLDGKRIFDNAGRLIEISYGNDHRSTYEYEDNGIETKIINNSFVNDSLTKRIHVTRINKTKQFSYYLEQDEQLDTLEEYTAMYDQNRNLVTLKHVDYDEFLRDHYEMEIEPKQEEHEFYGNDEVGKKAYNPEITYYHFTNVYDKGLLIKRVLDVKNEEGNSNIDFGVIERVIYEKEFLQIKSWPSEEKKEESYDYDFDEEFTESPVEIKKEKE